MLSASDAVDSVVTLCPLLSVLRLTRNLGVEHKPLCVRQRIMIIIVGCDNRILAVNDLSVYLYFSALYKESISRI